MREEVDLPLFYALEDEWALRPPVHLLVAAYLGYKGAKGAGGAPAIDVSDDIAPMLAEAGGAIPIKNAPAVDTSAWDALVSKQQESPDGRSV